LVFNGHQLNKLQNAVPLAIQNSGDHFEKVALSAGVIRNIDHGISGLESSLLNWGDAEKCPLPIGDQRSWSASFRVCRCVSKEQAIGAKRGAVLGPRNHKKRPLELQAALESTFW